MKNLRNRIQATRRFFSKPARNSRVIFRRLSTGSIESLELRALLASDLLTSDSAWYDTSDPHATNADVSVRCMLASSVTGSAAPMAQSLTTTEDTSSDPVATPLVDTPQLNFRLEVRNLSNQPITSLTVGQDFQLAVFVQDVRTPTPTPAGVFASYLNVSYDTALASISPSATFTYDPFFSITQTGSVSTPGQIVGAGASAASFTAPGNAEQLLWTIPVHAGAVGTLNFTSSFDTIAGHDNLLYGLDDPLPQGNVEFDTLTLQVFSDTVPTVAIGNVTQAEGNDAGTDTPYVFSVNLSDASGSPVTVAYSTGGGTATTPADYAATSGTLTFAAGVTQQLITVLVKGDLLDEADETFSVTLSSPTNATLSTSSVGTGTITDDDATPTLLVSSPSIIEGNSGTTNLLYTVSLSAASGRQITAQFATADGTATTGNSDYQATSGTLTFAAGDTTKLVTVAINGDTVKEANETFTLGLSNLVNATLNPTAGQGVATINNDDGPIINISPAQVSHAEGDAGTAAYVFTVSLSEPGDTDVTVVFNTQDDTATTAGSDYTGTSGTLTFSGETLTQTITVLANGDTANEADEKFKIVLSSPVGATIATSSAEGLIQNDDAPPNLSFDDDTVSVTEGDSGSGNVVFTVKLSETSLQAVTVEFTTQAGTATSGTDFTATSGTLTFAPGDTTRFITVAVTGDLLNEADETFTVRLFNSTNAGNALSAANPVVATATITDNDPPPVLSMNDVSHPEGNTGTTPFLFTAVLSEASGQQVRVTYNTLDGTATTADNDYQATSGTITFAPGETTKIITVLANGDAKFEPAEEFILQLAAVDDAVELADTSVIGTIANDDAPPTLAIGNATQVEGNSGTTNFLFTVTLSAASTSQVTVQFTTAPNTATTGVDFIGQDGSLTFAPGTTTQVITVAVNGDTLNEADETFKVNLSNPNSAATLSATSSGTGTITNDDAQPSLSIGNVSLNEGNSGTTPFVFVVTLSAPSGQTVTVLYATSNGSATTANNDYQATSGTLTFGPGVTTQNVTVNVVGDLFLETNENFSVTLSSPTNATLGTASGTGTILNEAGDNVTFTASTISGIAFIDSNKSGAKDTKERVLPNVAVTLTGTSSINNGAVTKSATTDVNGAYSFGDLEPGTYEVRFAQPNDYQPGSVKVGSQGGTALSNGLGFTTTIASPGGVTGANNLFMVAGLKPENVSQRLFLASTQFTGDGSGNQGATVSVAVTTVTSPVNSANKANTTASGTGTAGATVSLTVTDGTNTTSAKTATVAANGTWSIAGIDVTSLNDGTITYRATATSGSNTSSLATRVTTKDTTAPAVAVTSVTDPAKNSNSTAVAASGTGEVGATISLVVSNGSQSNTAKTGTVASNGTWSISGIDVSTLNDGTLTYTATSTDTAGNTATASKTGVKDTLGVTLTTVTAAVNSANQANTSASGTGESGANVSVTATDGTHTSAAVTGTVAANGTWSVSGIDVTSLNDGTITYSVVSTDSVSNSITATKTTNKDTTPPTILLVTVTDPTNNATAANTQASGTGEAGATLSIVATDGTHTSIAKTGTVAANGAWTITGIDVSGLDDGTITYTITATDAAGNAATDTKTGVKDTLSVALTTISGPINAASANNVTASGTGEAGATISVVASDGTTNSTPVTTTVAGNGTWTVGGINLTALSDGVIAFTATSTDSANNSTQSSKTATKKVAASPVDLATVTDPINTDNQATTAASGTAEGGAGISIVASDGTHTTTPQTTTAAANGAWSLGGIDVTGLDNGTITYTVTATDSFGNTATDTKTATKNTLVIDLAAAANIGPTNLTDSTASGTSDPGAAISVVVSDGTHTSTPVTTTADSNGTWSVSGIDATTLIDGPVTYTVTSTVGSVSATDTLVKNKDVTAPPVDLVTLTDPVTNANVTATTASGTAEAAAGISIVASDGTHTTTPQTTTADANGAWLIDGIDVSGLDDVTITYTVTATDGFGNTATDTKTAIKNTLTVELTFATPIIAGNVTNAGANGTGEPGATISVVVSDGTHTSTPVTTTVDSNGTWSVSGIDAQPLTDGDVVFTVTSTDADNTVTDSLTKSKDVVVPSIEIISVTNPVGNENKSNTSITGTAIGTTMVSVTVSDGTTTIGPQTATIGANDTWTVSGIDVSSLKDGTLTYTVTVLDTGGNINSDTITSPKETWFVTIDSVTSLVNSSNVTSAAASGTGEPGSAIALVVTKDATTSTTYNATVAANGTWSIANIDLTPVSDGTITWSVTSTDPTNNVATASTTGSKDTLAPEVLITTFTNPVNSDNVANAGASGTGEIGVGISLIVSDGMHTTIAYTTTVANDGNWVLTNIDLTSLDDGPITYTVTATDSALNAATDSEVATKDAIAEPLVETLAMASPGGSSNANDAAFGDDEYWLM